MEEKCFIIQCNNDIKTLLTKLKKVKYMSFMLVEKIKKQVYWNIEQNQMSSYKMFCVEVIDNNQIKKFFSKSKIISMMKFAMIKNSM